MMDREYDDLAGGTREQEEDYLGEVMDFDTAEDDPSLWDAIKSWFRR
jgi:hypothetical protein